MNAVAPLQSVTICTSSLLPLRQQLPIFCRHASSARRTAKKLRVKPDSFSSSIPPENVNDHIVFNPPSSAPSVYHTPVAFLPPNDPRRKLLAQSYLHANPYGQSYKRLPPPVRVTQPKKYHLGPEEIEEIRRLRAEDPFVNTRKKLAERFQCSQLFVGMICEASKERKDQQKQILANAKAKWGRRKKEAREDRAKRRELWGRDD